MLKRSEVTLVLLIAAGLTAAAVLGTWSAPGAASTDERLSTRLAGPNGARAFRSLLQALHVDVRERLVPFYDLDRTPVDPGRLLFVARPAPERPLTPLELGGLVRWVARGGRVLLAGRTGVERCFDWSIRVIDFAPPEPIRGSGAGRAEQPLPPPRARAVLRRPDGDRLSAAALRRICSRPEPEATESLWDHKGDPVAVRMRFHSGGRAVLVADAGLFSNRELRASDAGVLVAGWVLAERPREVVMDEYHQGFGRSGSLVGAVLRWALDQPAGWMVLQLVCAGLLALGGAAVRFGPVVPAVERRRRSPLEHLAALAAGLQRNRAGGTATRLIAAGLRRRLVPGPKGAGADPAPWLAALEAGGQNPRAREAVRRLRALVRPTAGEAEVLAAATTVEELWQILKVPTRTSS